MATSKRVSCTIKGKGTEHWNHILSIGGGSGSDKWTRTEATAIYNIENNIESYHVKVNDVDVKVIVYTYTESDGTKHKYLKTEADGYKPNNLVSLPACT
jgi:hypothetical protein